jgi:hypothetical protein
MPFALIAAAAIVYGAGHGRTTNEMSGTTENAKC